MSDFIPNQLSFDTSACLDALENVYNAHLDILSDQLINIVQRQIAKNGNGSDLMKLSAMAEVKETKRKITRSKIELEVGIDLNALKGEENVFVRVSVVLHGNMQGDKWTWRDARVMYTKPGQATWDKHVLHKAVHVPAEYKPRALPGFAQGDKMSDILYDMQMNTEAQIQKHVNDFVNAVNYASSQIDWSAFVTVS